MKKLSKILIVLAVCTVVSPAMADAPGNAGVDKHQRFKKMHGMVLRKHVGLDEAKAKEVEKVFERFSPRMRSLHGEMRAAKEELSQLVKSDSNDQKAYASVVAKLRKLHQATGQLREEQISAVAKKLQPKEQAKLLLALGHMKRKFHGKGHGCEHHGKGRGDRLPEVKKPIK